MFCIRDNDSDPTLLPKHQIQQEKDLFIFLSNLFYRDQGLLRGKEKVYMPFIIGIVNKKAISLP